MHKNYSDRLNPDNQFERFWRDEEASLGFRSAGIGSINVLFAHPFFADISPGVPTTLANLGIHYCVVKYSLED